MSAKDETEEKSDPVEAEMKGVEREGEREREASPEPPFRPVLTNGLGNLESREESRAGERLAEPSKARKGRRKAREAATAWKARNAEYLRRRSETIEFPEQALAIWRGEREELEAERRHGRLRGGVGRPKGLVRLAPMVGDSIERQVFAKVEHDRLLLKPGETLEAAIEGWPLPFTFFDPVPPLCEADEIALERQKMDERREERLTKEANEHTSDESHLLPGMKRQ